jgi:hypothetical protein
LLRSWREDTGGDFLFPGGLGRKHVLPASVEKFQRESLDLRGKHSPHSWRSAARRCARRSRTGRLSGATTTVNYVANPHTHFDKLAWNCRLRNDPDNCFRD